MFASYGSYQRCYTSIVYIKNNLPLIIYCAIQQTNKHKKHVTWTCPHYQSCALSIGEDPSKDQWISRSTMLLMFFLCMVHNCSNMFHLRPGWNPPCSTLQGFHWYTLGELFGGCSRRHVVKNFPRMSFPAREKRKITTKKHTINCSKCFPIWWKFEVRYLQFNTKKTHGCCFFHHLFVNIFLGMNSYRIRKFHALRIIIPRWQDIYTKINKRPRKWSSNSSSPNCWTVDVHSL